ncbi:MAG TPA: 6-phosphogluconolactonase [Ktedonobacteraceae bacterium]|jgi:6-phosphogluconolactonase
MKITIFPDGEQLSHAAARYVVQVANEALAARGRFTIALSGGSTPKKLYGLLALELYCNQIDWTKAEVFWGDERCVPPDDTESNYHLAHEVMLSKLPIPADQIHRMPADESDLVAASATYEQELRRVFGTSGVPSFDLIQLGLGPEAHTASLFPHQASLRETERLVIPVTVPKPPPPRLTFTPPILNAAKHILFLVTGAEKADAVRAILEGDYQPEEYPAQIVRPAQGEVTWMLDAAAASTLRQRR